MATISKYQTASGTTLYTVRYRTPDQRQTQKRGFTTKREAREFAATVETSKLRGEYVGASVGRTTVGELGPAWLARQRGHMKPSTFHACDSVWRTRVAPRWGSVRIADVRYTDVAAWVAELSAIRGPSLVRVTYSVLARILDDAVKDRMLAANPARGVKLPRQAPPRNTYLTATQLDMLASEAGPYRSLVLLLGVSGLRWGEAIALRVCDVDFLRRRIELHRNVVRVRSQFVVGSLKSNKNRTVAVPAFVMTSLVATAAGKGREDLLWTAPHGGYLRSPGPHSWLVGAVARCQAADDTFPRVTAHDLRHTAASLAISAGANPKVVQRMLGHASAAMTLDVYADLFECDLDAVAESVSKMCPRCA
jgi:integrase